MGGYESFWLPACHARGSRQAKQELCNQSETSLWLKAPPETEGLLANGFFY